MIHRPVAAVGHSTTCSPVRAASRGFQCPCLHGAIGPSSSPLASRSLAAPSALCRPHSRTPTILCSALRKERKKLAKMLKSHRKVLEKRLSALQTTEVDSPVFTELLTELRTLTSQLDNERTAALLHADTSSSDSDDGEACVTRPAATLSRHRTSPPPFSTFSSTPSSTSSRIGGTSSMVVSGLTGEVEVAVPEPLEGWDWDEEQFRDTKFDGAGGRVMVCTGSKCQCKGATEVLRAVSALSHGNPDIDVVPCKCVGKCSQGAAMRVRTAGRPCATYTEVRPAHLREVFQQHFGAAAGGATDAAAASAAAVAAVVAGVPAGVAAAGSGADLGAHPGKAAVCCAECERGA